MLSSFKADNELTKVSDHKHELHVCTFLWERYFFCKLEKEDESGHCKI